MNNNSNSDFLDELKKLQPVNLVLGGGGVKGVAHLALLQFLEKNNVKISAISGSSAGAMVAALYASGQHPEEILEFFESANIFRYTWINPMKSGLFNSSKYETLLKSRVKSRFDELSIPIYITATNMQRGVTTYFSRGELISPLLASCAVPAVFTPVDIAGELYSDGGVLNNFPVEPFVHSDNPIIGSYVCAPEYKSKADLNTILKITNHTNSLMLYAASKKKFTLTHKTILFPLSRYGIFDTKEISNIYEDALVHIENLKELEVLQR